MTCMFLPVGLQAGFDHSAFKTLASRAVTSTVPLLPLCAPTDSGQPTPAPLAPRRRRRAGPTAFTALSGTFAPLPPASNQGRLQLLTAHYLIPAIPDWLG